VSQLPDRPSLSHLRKQAKDLLRRLRQQNPDAALTDAQHALAREYGFDSWPKLKVHVERLAALPRAVTFQRYTPKAREAVFFARHEAAQLGSQALEPEHLLLGLIRASQGLTGRMFDQSSVSLERARTEMSSTPPQGTPSSSGRIAYGRMTTGDRARQVFRAAAAEADRFQHQDIGLAHLLLGVLHEPDSAAKTLLDGMGIRLESVRDRMSQLLHEEPL
jgi:hypothetical protein